MRRRDGQIRSRPRNQRMLFECMVTAHILRQLQGHAGLALPGIGDRFGYHRLGPKMHGDRPHRRGPVRVRLCSGRERFGEPNGNQQDNDQQWVSFGYIGFHRFYT